MEAIRNRDHWRKRVGEPKCAQRIRRGENCEAVRLETPEVIIIRKIIEVFQQGCKPLLTTRATP